MDTKNEATQGAATKESIAKVVNNGEITNNQDGKFAGLADSITQEADIMSKEADNENQPEKEKTIDEILEGARHDMTTGIVRPDFHFKVGGVEFLPSGGITAIAGHAKQGKSQWLTIMGAVLLSGRDFGRLQRVFPSNVILWIDTEQSQYDLRTNMERLYFAASIPPKTDAKTIGLHVFSLRPFSPEERLRLINRAIEKTIPDIVVIDGIRDLLHDFNDVKESDQIMTWLLKTTASMPQTNFICVLHTNDGTDKMRGHLGSELFNKSNDRFDVSKDNGFFSVKHTSRHLEINEFCFHIDEAGHLAPWEATKGAMVEDPQEVLHRVFVDAAQETMKFADIVRVFAKEAALSQNQAKGILKENCSQWFIKTNSGFRLK